MHGGARLRLNFIGVVLTGNQIYNKVNEIKKIRGVNAMPKVRAYVVISGRVQGVYYRALTREQARELGVNGWVKNRPDRKVEGLFEGDREEVDKLISWCRQGPPVADVTAVDVDWGNYTGEFSGFKIAF